MIKNKLTKSILLPVMTAAAMLGAGILTFADVASAATGTPSVSIATTSGLTTGQTGRGFGKGSGVSGTVTAINGTSITLTGKNSTTYTVNASNAKIMKISATVSSGTTPTTRPAPATITVADIAVGDTLMVQGTVSGSSVTAASIIDGKFSGIRGSWSGSGGQGQTPGVAGTVTAVSGNSITLTGKNSTVYTVDATSAKISKITPPVAGTSETSGTTGTTRPAPTAITVSQINMGDTLMVRGTVSGTSVTATNIIDGKFGGFSGRTGTGTHSGTASPHVGGTVTAVNADSVTVTETPKSGTPVVYTVNVSSAKITQRGARGTTPATITASAITVGEKVMVQGTVSGTSVTATNVTVMPARTTMLTSAATATQ